VKQGARWRIGSGVNIPFLGAPWHKDGLSLSTTNPIFEPLMQVNLSEFIDQDLKVWKAPLTCSLFDAHTSQAILDTPLQPLVTEDKIIWKGEKKVNILLKVRIKYVCLKLLITLICMHMAGGMLFGN